MNEKELAFIIIKAGVTNQRNNPDDYTEVNENAAIKNAGKSAIESTLEFLYKKKVVQDYFSTFGEYGHGFAFKISSGYLTDFSDDNSIRDGIDILFDLPNKISEHLKELINVYAALDLNIIYKDYLLASLTELNTCFNTGSYIACLTLCDQIFQTALMKIIDDRKSTFDYGSILKDSQFLKHFDQPLTERGIIINKKRAVARKKLKMAIPTRYQAAIEIQAVIDNLKNLTGRLTEA